VSIWSSIGGAIIVTNGGSGTAPTDGVMRHDIDVATSWGWSQGIRILDLEMAENFEGVLDRENALRLIEQLQEAVDTYDRKDRRNTTA
jgi:hypothetical protein